MNNILAQRQLFDVKFKDKFGFLLDINNWNNHKPLLLLSLYLTDGNVVEYGSGNGSTPYLEAYCKAHNRKFRSYDNNMDWCQRTGATFIENWDEADIWHSCSVAFVDHAPGEHRHIAISKLVDKAEIIVVHDSEENGAGNYQLDKIWQLFKYRLNYNRHGGGAGTTALSNTIDLTLYRGCKLGEYVFDND